MFKARFVMLVALAAGLIGFQSSGASAFPGQVNPGLQAEAAAKRMLKKLDPSLKNNMLALDIARDKRGKWHVIETNPGPDSGFLSPASAAGFMGPHKLYHAVT